MVDPFAKMLKWGEAAPLLTLMSRCSTQRESMKDCRVVVIWQHSIRGTVSVMPDRKVNVSLSFQTAWTISWT